MTVFAHSVPAPTSLHMRALAQVEQGRKTWGNLEYDISALTAIAPIGTTHGNEFFPAEGNTTGAAIPGFYMHCDFINKVHIFRYFLDLFYYFPDDLVYNSGIEQYKNRPSRQRKPVCIYIFASST
jgi:hypothetical protein